MVFKSNSWSYRDPYQTKLTLSGRDGTGFQRSSTPFSGLVSFGVNQVFVKAPLGDRDWKAFTISSQWLWVHWATEHGATRCSRLEESPLSPAPQRKFSVGKGSLVVVWVQEAPDVHELVVEITVFQFPNQSSSAQGQGLHTEHVPSTCAGACDGRREPTPTHIIIHQILYHASLRNIALITFLYEPASFIRKTVCPVLLAPPRRRRRCCHCQLVTDTAFDLMNA
jgi:hypothetical protein